MMQTCKISCTQNTGCCELHHRNIVSFDNLKTKYSINEDIRIEYTLHGDVQKTSTRDWLGIFPRGWSNLQQYLTFEYALVAPRAAASSNRTIIFPRVFHQEACTSIEYQLVYVSREIQVLASSSYFRFTREEIPDTLNRVLRIPNHRLRNSSSEKQEIEGDQLFNSGLGIPHIVSSDQSLSNRSKTIIPVDPRLSRTCKTCARVCDSVCGIAMNRARFLVTRNVSLAERIVRLERDLRFSEVAKLNLSQRLKAYENFVNELLESLATKKIVKITDASGKEIVLQQISNLSDNSDDKLAEDLKLINDNGNHSLSANDRESVGEYLSCDKLLVTKSGEEKIDEKRDEFNDRDKKELDTFITVENKRTSTDVETQTNCKSISDGNTTTCEACVTIEPAASNCDDKRHDENKIEENEICETVNAAVDDFEELSERQSKGDNIADEKNDKCEDCSKATKTLNPKPSAIVIQGSNVKFAIIRY